jgi:hypothetical protein
LRTIKLLNDSYANSTQNFYKLVDQESDSLEGNQSALEALPETARKLYKITTNFMSGKLMNDNTYAFSYNSSLLDLSVEDLLKLSDVRLSYVQVDSMNKCVPQDWFLGYDQFAVYTFHKLTGQIQGQAGYLKTNLRTGAVNSLGDHEALMVNYSQDFTGNLNHDDEHFYLYYAWHRLQNIFFTFFDLGMCYSLSSFAAYLF